MCWFIEGGAGNDAERENRDPDRDDDSEGDSGASPTGKRKSCSSDTSFTNGNHSVSVSNHIISLRRYAFGTYLCKKARQEASDLGDFSQKHIDATI